MVSHTENAEHSGQELFKTIVAISVDVKKIDQLTDAIESLADDLVVELTY